MHFRSVDDHPNELADLRIEKRILGRSLELLVVACPQCGKEYYYDQDDFSAIEVTGFDDAHTGRVDLEESRADIFRQFEVNATSILQQQHPTHSKEFECGIDEG